MHCTGRVLGGHMKKLIFTVDDLNYRGGAHVALFNQIEYLLGTGKYEISILSKTGPEEALAERLKGVSFLPDHYTSHGRKSLLKKFDCVCVPFENSVYRKTVASSKCPHKIQWIHIDYFEWRKTNPWTLEASKNDREIYKKFDSIVFVSRASRQGFAALYPELEEKCTVCYNLMDTARIYDMAQKESEYAHPFLKENVPHLVTVARVENTQKGVFRYIQIARRLREEGYDFEWLFLGDGPELEEARALCEKYGLGSSLRFLGQTANPYVYMQKADLFALFSYYEGIPNTVFEALILGVPVIATAISGVREQITEDTGLLVANTEESIFSGLKTLLDRPEQIRARRDKLQSYRYDNDQIKEKLDRIFASNEPFREEIKVPPLLSVIVPVYNVERYLSQCLRSLVNQTLENIEIIVVNDGSTDGSQEIIDSFQKQYPEKIFPYIKENGGLGSARNFGIERASGYFVAFVDSDDWVVPDGYEKMYQKAISGNYDIVLCDILGYDENTKQYITDRAPYKKEGKLEKKESILLSTRPVAVSACTKLFRRDIFQSFSFQSGWYEDLGIMTTIFSFTGDIYYLPEPLYVYRWNRKGSIQNQKDSIRTMDIFRAKQQILDNCNRAYLEEGVYAVYDHVCRFQKDYPQYLEACIAFLNREGNRALFSKNQYIQEAINKGKLSRLFGEEAIPKKIHYCWFGRGEKPPVVKACIQNWREKLPGYEIIEWNEENCNINENKYVQQAYKKGKWAFVADYFRFKVLYEQGGIYLDTDVKIYRSLDSLLFHEAFFAFETYLYVHGGIIGAQPKQKIVKEILDSYEGSVFKEEEIYTVCHRITDILLEHKLETTARFQMLDGNVAIYPPNILTVDFSDGQCIAEHLYNASWLEQGETGRTYKYEVMKHFFAVQRMAEQEESDQIDGAYYKQEYEKLLSSRSWKITKPLRWFMDRLRLLRDIVKALIPILDKNL